MIIRNNKTEELEKRLKEEGKTSNLEDKSNYFEIMERLNAQMREIVRDFKYKSGHSWIEAGKYYVDAVA